MIDDIPTHIMDAARECHNRIMAQSEGVGLTEARAVYNIAQTIMEQRFSERLQELEGQIHVPGSWHCPKCKFTLQQMVMSAQDCSVAPQDKPGEPCPNCQSPLWRVTWKQDALEMAERAEEQLNARVSLENQLAATTKKLADLFNENGTPRFNAVCERAERAEAKLTAIDTALSAGRFIAIRKILRSQTSDPATLINEGPNPAAPVSGYVPLCSTKGYHLILDITVTEDEEPGCRVQFAGVIEDAEIDGFPFSCEGYCIRIETGNTAYIMLESATLNTLTALRTAYYSIVERDLVSEPLILGALAAQGIEPSSRVKITFKNGEYPQS